MALPSLRYRIFSLVLLLLVAFLIMGAAQHFSAANAQTIDLGMLAVLKSASPNAPAALEFYSPDAQRLYSLPLPDDMVIAADALSPDGRYWVRISGAVSGPEVVESAEALQSDLTLHINSTRDGAEVRAIPLLPANFPANVAISTDLLLARDPTLEDSDFFEESVWQAFKYSLGTFEWSPDGSQLAFSAAIDGPSSDLYLYDTASDSVRRLTDGIEQIDGIRWSPDGQWIWHSSISYGYCQTCDGHHYAAAVDGSGVVTLPGDDVYRFLAWTDGDSYLVTDQSNGPGDFDLQRVDIATGRSVTLWAGTHQGFVYDEGNGRLGIVGTRGQTYDPNERIFVIDLETGDEQEFENEASALAAEPWLAPIIQRPISYPCRRANPIVYPCLDTPYDPLSPDGMYQVGEDFAVVEVSSGEERLPPLPDLAFGRVLWRPDGGGFFITQVERVLYRDLETGDLTALEGASILRWLPLASPPDFAPSVTPAATSTRLVAPAPNASPTPTVTPSPTAVATPIITDLGRGNTLVGSYNDLAYTLRMGHAQELATISQAMMAQQQRSHYAGDDLYLLLAREAAATYLYFPDSLIPGPAIDQAAIQAQTEREVTAALDRSLEFSPPRVATYPTTGELGSLSSLAISPDGKVVATGDIFGTVRLWDYDGGFLLRVLPSSDRGIYHLEFSSDSARLAAADGWGQVLIWEAQSGNKRADHVGQFFSTTAAIWRPDSYDMAIAQSGSPVLINPDRGDTYALLEESGEVLAYSPDGNQLAVALDQRPIAGNDGTIPLPFETEERPIWIVDADTGAVLHELPDDDETDYMAYTPAGDRLITTGDKVMRVWDIATSSLLYESQLVDFPNGWALTPEGETLVILSRRGGISFYRVSDGVHLRSVATDADSLAWLAIHPVDDQLISGATDGRPVLVDATTGVFDFRFDSPDARLVTTSPATTLFATVDERVITVRDLSGQRPDRQFADATRYVTDIAISPDGRWLAALEQNGYLYLWDLDSGALMWRASDTYTEFGSVAFTSDGRLVVGGNEGVLRVVAVANGGVLDQLAVGQPIESFAVSSRNEATLVVDRPLGMALRVNLDDLAAGVFPFPAIDGVEGAAGDIAYSPDGSLLALPRRLNLGGDVTLEFWETASNRRVRTIPFGYQWDFSGLTFSPDGKRIATGPTNNHALTIWEVATGRPLQRLGDPNSFAHSHRLAFTPDGIEVLSSYDFGITTRFALSPTHELRTITAHRGGVWDVDVRSVADEQWAITVADDGRARVRDWQTGAPLYHAIEEAGRIYSVDFSPNGDAILTGGQEGLLHLYYAGGDLQSVFAGHRSWIIDAIFSPDGKAIASASNDNSVRVWNRARVSQSWVKEDLPWGVTAIAYSPDSTLLAASVGIGPDAAILIWDAYSGEELMQLRGHRNFAIGLAFSPDGTLLASASWDRTIKLWDVATGDEVAALEGHSEILTDIAFSPDGTTIASIAEDYTLRLWDVATRSLRTTIEMSRTLPWAVAFSPDGHALLTTHADGTLRTWLADPADNSLNAKLLVAAARLPRATAEFTAAERDKYAIDSYFGWYPLSHSGKVNWRLEPYVTSMIALPPAAGETTETLVAMTNERFLFSSTDHGERWSLVARLPLTYTFTSLGIPARASDPLLIASEQGIYRVGDDGTLTLVHSDSFTAVSYSHTSPNELWGIHDAQVYKSEDGGRTWGAASNNLSSASLYAPLLLIAPNNNPQLVAGQPNVIPRPVIWRGAGNGFWEQLTAMPVLPLGAGNRHSMAWDNDNRTLYRNGAKGELFVSTSVDAPNIANVTASIVEQFGIGARPLPLAVGQGPSLYVNLITPYGPRLVRGIWDGERWQWVALRLPIVGAG